MLDGKYRCYPALQMFKILLLQQWYGLSDLETERAMFDRIEALPLIALPLRGDAYLSE